MNATTSGKWTVETVTGSDLVDAAGRVTGPEKAGRIISTHRSREAADRAAETFRHDCPLGSEVAVFGPES